MSTSPEISPLSEAFRLAVEGSPVADPNYRILDTTGSSEALLTTMTRHEARVGMYAQLAGIPRDQAAQAIQRAAEMLNEAQGEAITKWSDLCAANAGDFLSAYDAAYDQEWVRAYAAAAMLTVEEALQRLTRNHLIGCDHYRS